MIDTDFHKLDPRKSIVFLPMDGQFKQDVGENLLVDGDMEAVGTGAWTPNDSTLSKITTSPYQGTQSLRITATAATFWAYQTILTINQNFSVKGQARSDGSSYPRINGLTVWSGTNDMAWQNIDFVSLAIATEVYIGSGSASGYVDFDAMDIREYPQVTRSLSLLTGANDYARLGTGHLSTAYPTSLSPRGLSFDGGDYINLDWSAGSALDTQTFTFVMYGKPTTPVADDRIYEIGIAGQRYSLYFDLSAGNLVCWKDDTVDKTIVTAKGYPDGQEHVYAFSFSVNGMNLYVDGELEGSILGDVRLASFNASTKAYIGQDVAGGNQYNGNMYSVAIYDFELTNVQIRECGRRMIQMRNI